MGSVIFLVFSSTSTFTFFRVFGANLVTFRVRKVDVRGKVDVQAPKSQFLYVNIDVPYVNKITLDMGYTTIDNLYFPKSVKI